MVKDKETKTVELFLMDGQSIGNWKVKVLAEGRAALYKNGKRYEIDLSETGDSLGTIYAETPIAGADLMNLATNNGKEI